MTEAASFKRRHSYEASLNTLDENSALEEIPTIHIKALDPPKEFRIKKDMTSQKVDFSRLALKFILQVNQRVAPKVFQAAVQSELILPYYLAIANSVLKKQKVKPHE